MTQDQAKELAFISSIITREDILDGTIFNTFEQIWRIANLFLEKYPINTNWEKVRESINLDYDETIIEFTKKSIKN